MKISVTAEGNDLDAPTSPRFGRCPTFVFVETDTMTFEAMPNPALSASGGAGIQAAQFMVEQGAQAVLTGNLGPNAADVFQAATIPVYLNNEPTVRAAVQAFKAGRLSIANGPNVEAHAGMGMRRRQRQERFVVTNTARREEIATLRTRAVQLRQELADVIDRIEKLEKES